MPWITDDIRRKMSRCFELFKQKVKLKDGEIRHDYKSLRDNIKADVSRAKAAYSQTAFTLEEWRLTVQYSGVTNLRVIKENIDGEKAKYLSHDKTTSRCL